MTKPPASLRSQRQELSWRHYGPSYWPTWLTTWAIRAAGALSYPARISLGTGVGAVLYHMLRARRQIASINLRLCFPERDEASRAELLREHFTSLGISIVEMAAAWTAPAHALGRLVEVEGMEHFDRALAGGRGAIVVSGHFLSMEMGMRLFTDLRAGYGVYRPHNNPVMDNFIQAGRARYQGVMLDRADVRGIVRALKSNLPVWYPPDQDHGMRYSVFAPFFGVPAATLTATSRLARMTGAAVLPLYTQRLEGTRGYRVRVFPSFEDFPSGDDIEDASRFNCMLEQMIRAQPHEYLWVHRRFKSRPPGEAPVYR